MATSGNRCLAREFISSIFVQDQLRMKNNPGWRSIPPGGGVGLPTEECSSPRTSPPGRAQSTNTYAYSVGHCTARRCFKENMPPLPLRGGGPAKANAQNERHRRRTADQRPASAN